MVENVFLSLLVRGEKKKSSQELLEDQTVSARSEFGSSGSVMQVPETSDEHDLPSRVLLNCCLT